MITNEVEWNITTRGTWHEENVGHECVSREAKAPDSL